VVCGTRAGLVLQDHDIPTASRGSIPRWCMSATIDTESFVRGNSISIVVSIGANLEDVESPE
jgi:hypothetical protein